MNSTQSQTQTAVRRAPLDFFKKILTFIVAALTLIALGGLTLGSPSAFAQDDEELDPDYFLDEEEFEFDEDSGDTGGATEGISLEEFCADPSQLSADDRLICLFPPEDNLITESPQGDGTSLPSGHVTEDFLPFFINTALSIAGTLIFIVFLYAGYLMIFANDKEENIEKGKRAIINAIIGAFVIAISYAVIYGIATLDLD